MEIAGKIVGGVLTFLFVITVPAPIWVALFIVAPIVATVIAIMTMAGRV